MRALPLPHSVSLLVPSEGFNHDEGYSAKGSWRCRNSVRSPPLVPTGWEGACIIPASAWPWPLSLPPAYLFRLDVHNMIGKFFELASLRILLHHRFGHPLLDSHLHISPPPPSAIWASRLVPPFALRPFWSASRRPASTAPTLSSARQVPSSAVRELRPGT